MFHEQLSILWCDRLFRRSIVPMIWKRRSRMMMTMLVWSAVLWMMPKRILWLGVVTALLAGGTASWWRIYDQSCTERSTDFIEFGHAVWIHMESREMWILLTSRAVRTVTWNFVKPAICFCDTNYNVFADNVSLNVLVKPQWDVLSFHDGSRDSIFFSFLPVFGKRRRLACKS